MTPAKARRRVLKQAINERTPFLPRPLGMRRDDIVARLDSE